LGITPGNETDFGQIEADILELCRQFLVLSVAFDPWNATQLAQRLTDQEVPCSEFRMNTQNLSEATKETEAQSVAAVSATMATACWPGALAMSLVTMIQDKTYFRAGSATI
jgi:hypothetical protein